MNIKSSRLSRRIFDQTRAVLALSATLALVACGDDDDTTSTRDASPPVADLGVDLGAVDLGGELDASVPTEEDAGVDAGPPLPADGLIVVAGTAGTWVYVKVGAGVVSIVDGASSLGWDVAFSRTQIRTNGGTSGAGVGGALERSDVDYDTLESTDTVGFACDEEIETGMPGAAPTSLSPALTDWYDYDPATHSVTPTDTVFALRTADGAYAKLRITGWDVATGAYTLRLAPIVATPALHTLAVDASSSTDWAYVDLDAAATTTVTTPASDAHWDLAIRRTAFATNGGASGAESGGARLVDTDFDATREVPADGFVIDTTITPAMPGATPYAGNTALGGWYDYDPATHTVSPKDVTFVVRLADGSASKLRISAYAAGVYTLDFVYAGPARTSF